MTSDRRTFTYPDDASRFPASTQSILQVAADCGWSFHWLGTGHRLVGITSPDKVKSITVPSTSMRHDRARSTLNQIRRYSDEAVFDATIDKTIRPGVKGGLRYTIPTGPEEPAPRVPRAPAQVRAAAADAAVEEYDTALAAAMREAEAKTAEPVAVPSSGQEGRTLVSETPWMVRKDGVDGSRGRMYESHNVIHRVWSDGFEDFRCRFCEYVNENPRSVSAHASRLSDHPKREGPIPIREVPVYTETGIRHSDNTVRRLNAEILHALDAIEGWQDMDRETLARTLATSIHEAKPDRTPAEPLTPEQIISRITLMVDGGRLAEMHQSIESMAETVRNATEAADAATRAAAAANEEVERLREERRVLRDLLSEDRSAS